MCLVVGLSLSVLAGGVRFRILLKLAGAGHQKTVRIRGIHLVLPRDGLGRWRLCSSDRSVELTYGLDGFLLEAHWSDPLLLYLLVKTFCVLETMRIARPLRRVRGDATLVRPIPER